MARGDSTIRVSIIGDARKLVGALGDADRASGGLLASAGKVLVAGAVIRQGFDLVGDALDQADRVGDATARLNIQLGEVNTQSLKDLSGEMSALGQSAPDVLELAANFADLASAATDLTDAQIAQMAPDIIAVAAAVERLGGQSAEAGVTAIGKFISGARGAQAAALELGLEFNKDSTAAERFQQVMAALGPKVDQVAGATAGLDDKQAQLGAKWETFLATVGPGIEEHLSNVLDFIIDEVNAIPGAIIGWQRLGAVIEGGMRDALGPIARVNDLLQTMLGLLGQASRGLNRVGNDPIGDFIFGERGVTEAQQRERARNGQGAR